MLPQCHIWFFHTLCCIVTTKGKRLYRNNSILRPTLSFVTKSIFTGRPSCALLQMGPDGTVLLKKVDPQHLLQNLNPSHESWVPNLICQKTLMPKTSTKPQFREQPISENSEERLCHRTWVEEKCFRRERESRIDYRASILAWWCSVYVHTWDF